MQPRPVLSLLRGGVIRGSGSYPGVPVVEPVSPMGKVSAVESTEMSSAERVYVVQQFQRQEVRKSFIKKVYLIVALQLAATAGVIASLRMSPHIVIALLRRMGYSLLLLPMIPAILMQRGDVRTKAPLNYILLASFTALQALAIGSFTSFVPLYLILKAAGITAVATGALSVYALSTKRDFTPHGALMFSAVLAANVLGIFQLLFGGSWLNSLRAYVCALAFAGYLIYDTQRLMGGDKRQQLRPTEHVMAALAIYMDIVQLFINILQLLAASEDGRQ